MKNVSDEILCLPNNIEAIAEVTVRILNDKRFTNKIVRSIRKYALDTSWEEIAKKHLTLYQRFL